MKKDLAQQAGSGCPDADLAGKLAALAHPARLGILRHLADSECCCKEVVGRLDLAQSTVSQHLKVLVEAGLVRFTPERQRSLYRLEHAALAELAETLDRLMVSCRADRACIAQDAAAGENERR